MRKFTGEIFWLLGDYKQDVSPCNTGKAIINRAILLDGIFKIDHKNPNFQPDSEIRLRTKNGFEFDGSMKYIYDKKPSALVNMKYYENNERVILLGKWVEDSIVHTCIIELNEVQDFKE